MIGLVPNLVFAFFSPGLDSEGALGWLLGVFSLATLIILVLVSVRIKSYWTLTALQAVLIGLVLYETYSDAALYMGT